MSLLIDITVRSSAIVLIALAAWTLLQRRSAAWRHWVLASGILAAATVVPLSLTMPAWGVAIAPQSEMAGAALPPAGSLSAAAEVALPPADSRDAGFTRLALNALPFVWAIGVAIGLLLMATGVVRLLRLLSRTTPIGDERWLRMSAQARARYGLRRSVSLWVADTPDVLGTCGLLRPRVLLPADAHDWSDQRALAVLYHELAHVRRCDWAVQVVADALRTMFWFNPLIWIACICLRREGERACDDVVLDTGMAATDYATHLVEIARGRARLAPAWIPALSMARPSTLEGRIAAMLNTHLDRRTPSRFARVAMCAALVGFLIPTAGFRLLAQDGPSTLSGFVYDASGAVLPGVVVALDDGRQTKRDTRTDASGRFAFEAIAPGSYTVEATLPGFRPLRTEFGLAAPQDWTRAITLQVGDLSEQVIVAARRTPGTTARPAGGVTEPLKIGGNIRAPRKLKDVRPEYPESMRAAGLDGVVPIEALIGRDGAVVSVRVLSAQVHPDFARAAEDAVRQWRFSPTLLNGAAVEVRMTVSVGFSLVD